MHAKWKLSASALVAAGLAIGAASPALASSGRPAVKPSAAHTLSLSEVRALLRQVQVGMPLAGVHQVTADVSNGITKRTSSNWSGYADSGAANSFTSVSGHWVQPKGTCIGTGESLAAFWVGIDGISSSDPTVEQDGTLILCDFGQLLAYVDWWETYPANLIQIVSESVKPGDHISAKVSFSGSTYTLSLTDSTTPTGNSFSVKEPCGAKAGGTCENMSAEWIAEAPATVNGVIVTLAKFTTWKMTSARTTYNGKSGTISSINAPTTDEITIADSAKKVQAAPSALNSTGNAFSVVWKSGT